MSSRFVVLLFSGTDSGSGGGSGAGSGPSTLGPETTSGQLGDYDQSPAGELEEECQAIREGEEAVTHWDLVSEHSHSNLETEKRAAAAGGGDGTGNAAPSQGGAAGPNCLTRLTRALAIT